MTDWITCPNCGASLSDENKYCPYCGPAELRQTKKEKADSPPPTDISLPSGFIPFVITAVLLIASMIMYNLTPVDTPPTVMALVLSMVATTWAIAYFHHENVKWISYFFAVLSFLFFVQLLGVVIDAGTIAALSVCFVYIVLFFGSFLIADEYLVSKTADSSETTTQTE